MTTRAIERISADPDWLPHRLDLAARRVEFYRIPRERLSGPGFLFEFEPEGPEDREFVSLDRLSEIVVELLPVHFIFHSAFCRSTLLARALEIDGVSLSLSEPGILADLASAGREAHDFIAPLVHLLARKRANVSAIFVKPTNHANRLIPALMDAMPDARAILMTNPVGPFLESVRKRGLMGHRWGRRYYLELQRDHPVDFGMPQEEIFAMTDLQAAGVAWLLNQRYFAQLASGAFAGRLRTLNGDYFNRHRGETIAAVLNFCDLGQPNLDTVALAESRAFATHAKLGGKHSESSVDDSTAQEIAQVSHWLGLIGAQMDLSLPAPQNLL